MRRTISTLTCFIILVTAVSLRAECIGFRGDGTGKFNGTPTTQWSQSPAKNIAWIANVGPSFAGPAVAGDRIFVGSEPNKLLCIDRTTGKTLWEKATDTPDLPADKQNVELAVKTSCGFTTPAPVCDGKFVYQLLGNGLATCFDLEGNRKWVIFLDRALQSEYGRSALPLLVEGKLILPVSDFTAVDPADGKIVWENKDADSSYGSPIVVQVDGKPVIVTPHGDVLRPADGTKLASDLGTCTYASPVADGPFVFFASNTVNAVKLEWKPDGMIDPRKLWEGELEGDIFSSPVIHNGLIFVVNSNAAMSIFDQKTGTKQKWGDDEFKNLDLSPGGASKGDDGPTIFNSLALANGSLYVFNNAGNAFIYETTKDLKEIAHNDLSDGSNGTPAFTGSQMLMRSGTDLLCIQEKK